MVPVLEVAMEPVDAALEFFKGFASDLQQSEGMDIAVLCDKVDETCDEILCKYEESLPTDFCKDLKEAVTSENTKIR